MQTFLKNIFSPKGKLNRVQFLIAYIISILFVLLAMFTSEYTDLSAFPMILVTVGLFGFIYIFVISHLKRFRDLKWSALLLIVAFILNPILSIIMFFVPGKENTDIVEKKEAKDTGDEL